ncbi:MAG TPA: efflux RND transporter periplasmic adaptor subunit [Puia sp.]|nr:efflux RND transporter periplasmic adaptor subunit [Puia sp.]
MINQSLFHKPASSFLWLSLLFIGTACGNHGTKPSAQQDIPPRDTAAAFILHTDTAKKTVELPAELLPYQRAELYAKVQGFVRTMKVDIGARVRKGQTLAIIEAPEIDTRLEEMQATLQAARAKYASSKDNYLRLHRAAQAPTPGIVAPVDLEHAQDQMLADSAAYQAASKQMQASKEVSGYLYIIAPFTGVITARQADAGTLVGATVPLLTIQDDRLLRLRIAVPEAYTASAGAIHTISFRVEAWPGHSFPATLTRKSETIDPATRTELWEFEVDNDHRELKSGAFAYAQFNLQRNGLSFLVPPSAISTTQEKKFVIRVKDNKVEWVEIAQGITTDKGIEIFGRLSSGDTLLTKATDERKPGATAYWKVRH